MNLIINRILCVLVQLPMRDYVLLALLVFVLIPVGVHNFRICAVFAKEEGLTTWRYILKSITS